MKQASNRVSPLFPSVSLATTKAFTVGGPGWVRIGYGVSFCCLKAERDTEREKNKCISGCLSRYPVPARVVVVVVVFKLLEVYLFWRILNDLFLLKIWGYVGPICRAIIDLKTTSILNNPSLYPHKTTPSLHIFDSFYRASSQENPNILQIKCLTKKGTPPSHKSLSTF